MIRIASACDGSLRGERDRALLLGFFAGAFRRSELVRIRVADLTFGPHGPACTGIKRDGSSTAIMSCFCFLPLYVFCGRHLLAAKLRRSNIDASAGAVEEIARIVAQIRKRWSTRAHFATGQTRALPERCGWHGARRSGGVHCSACAGA